ncbi:hypothetical protein Ahy_B10g101027 isoform D [Arachis hypogaea]|uniref:RRM domain-containing protein n=1 Tax=Arachis hypogaea TaxID=3818 RepID=A0A444WYG9_ARAHY|nr:hypothetical protein Ahy_B10g101027 isoform D [Arachis hypogaea]
MSDIENHASLRGRSSPDKPISRGSAHESSRMRRQDDERKTFHDRHRRDHKVGRFMGRGKYDNYNRHKKSDYDRHNDRVYDGETKHKYGAHLKRSRRKSRSRSRSRSRSPSRKRTSGFDMAPPTADVTPAVSGQILGTAHTIQGTSQNLSPFGISQMGTLSVMHIQPMTQQATRHARRVYVGGLPPLTNEQTIAAFFSQVMITIGGNSAGADYNPSLAAALGPSQPSPHLNLSAVGLAIGAVGGTEGLDRIFVGGLSYCFTEEQIRQLLESFGTLHAFDLVRDKDTGHSKGYGFCTYENPAVTDIACASLNGLKMGDKTLTKIALEVGGSNIPWAERVPTTIDETPTKVLCLTEAVTSDQLRDDEEYEEILEDMRDECRKFGALVNVVIPRPNPGGELPPGIGKVFLEYSDNAGCSAAKNALHGRKFGGNVVTAVYYSEEKYHDAARNADERTRFCNLLSQISVISNR